MTATTTRRSQRVVLCIAAVLAAGPAFGAPGERTIADAAAAAARRAVVASPRPPMRPALKWTGIALLMAGAAAVADGAQGCHPSSGICKDRRRFKRGLGYASGATGTALLGIGAATRHRGVSIGVDESRLTVSHRLSF